MDVCEFCGREKPLTFHHLIPVAVHRKRRYLLKYGKEEMKKRGVRLCRVCHNGIHTLFPDEKVLADSYNTKELLENEPRMAKHIQWAKKQK